MKGALHRTAEAILNCVMSVLYSEKYAVSYYPYIPFMDKFIKIATQHKH